MIALYVDGRVNLDASLEDVETAIHSLDGSQCTLVVVELASGKTITIGGGPGKVVAELSEDDTHRWCVVDPQRPGGKIQLVVGGQLVDPPARICIEKEAALEAARTFVSENGARSRHLEWSVET